MQNDRFVVDKTDAFRDFIASMSPEEIDELNRLRRKHARRQMQRRSWSHRSKEINVPAIPGGHDGE